MLSSSEVRAISQNDAFDGRETRTFSDTMVVYLIKDGTYYKTTLSKISDLNQYEVKAYYDSTAKKRNVIHILVAREYNKN